MPVPQYNQEEYAIIKQVLDDGYLNEGKYVRQFEKEFADYVHARFCVFVPNGAIALWMAIETTDYDTFSIPDYYSIFAANALIMAGRKVEIHDETGGLMLPVHVNGRIEDTNNAVIEDCCQAPFHHTKGLISCYSFHSTKLITCGGIGGAVCVDDYGQYEQLVSLKDHGRPERAIGVQPGDIHNDIGLNFKMSDINAAFGLVQLKKLPQRIQEVRDEWKAAHTLLGDKVEWLGEPSWRVDCLTDMDMGKPFYTPTHRQPQFRLPDERFPRTNALVKRGRYLD